MTYLDQYHGMSNEELCEWADSLFRRAIEDGSSPRLTEVRNIVPFLIERVRNLDRQGLSQAQQALHSQADRLFSQGKMGESLKLRSEAARLGRGQWGEG